MEALLPLGILIVVIVGGILSFKPLMRASLKEEREWQTLEVRRTEEKS